MVRLRERMGQKLPGDSLSSQLKVLPWGHCGLAFGLAFRGLAITCLFHLLQLGIFLQLASCQKNYVPISGRNTIYCTPQTDYKVTGYKVNPVIK